ncbi:MAG: hypothetical protein AAFU49_06165 [Pseudomonadota bacterium]
MNQTPADWRAHGAALTDLSTLSEDTLRACIPVYVNSFNQLTYLKDMLDWLKRHGFANIYVTDQTSDYPPLLDYYAELEAEGRVRIIRLGENIGPTAIVWRITAAGGPFIFSDPDLTLPEPADPALLSTLVSLSQTHLCRKVGLALELPSQEECRDTRQVTALGEHGILEWESQFWENEVAPDIYRAPVDTTFFLWNPAVPLDHRRIARSLRRRFRPFGLDRLIPEPDACDLRVARAGFLARHRPWYWNDGMPEEEARYYTARAQAWSNWTQAETNRP